MTEIRRVAILGAGGMGVALATIWSKRSDVVRVWGRDPIKVETIRTTRRNETHLPGVQLPPKVEITNDPAEACDGAELVVAAIPSAYLRTSLAKLAEAIPDGLPIVSVVKGIEAGTLALPSRIVEETLGERPIAILSGPSHAEEFSRGLPTSVVVASSNLDLAESVQAGLNDRRFRVYTNDDPRGVELAGALKNVVAIAAGVCDGLGLGDNAKSALVTRGLVEVARMTIALGGRQSTIFGLAGVGDLMTTCFSEHSRNWAIGHGIGQGMALADLIARTTNVAEGVTTARSVPVWAERLGIEMPIGREVDLVLHEGKDPWTALDALMQREPRPEWTR